MILRQPSMVQMGPIIFLDFGGVLRRNIPDYYRLGDGYFDPECVAVLNELVRISLAKVCIVSDERRNHTLESLRHLFQKERVYAEIVGMTSTDIDELDLPDGNYLDRGVEIDDWISRNKPTSFVIIDDNNDMRDELCKKLIQTIPENGLTEEDIQLALIILSAGLLVD